MAKMILEVQHGDPSFGCTYLMCEVPQGWTIRMVPAALHPQQGWTKRIRKHETAARWAEHLEYLCREQSAQAKTVTDEAYKLLELASHLD
jgi:hypothetical protein